jgi:Ca2+-binding EF-hand superfamily protein
MMRFTEWLHSAAAWISAMLNRKVCSVEELRLNAESALDACDPDGDGNVSVREFITFVLSLV